MIFYRFAPGDLVTFRGREWKIGDRWRKVFAKKYALIDVKTGKHFLGANESELEPKK